MCMRAFVCMCVCTHIHTDGGAVGLLTSALCCSTAITVANVRVCVCVCIYVFTHTDMATQCQCTNACACMNICVCFCVYTRRYGGAVPLIMQELCYITAITVANAHVCTHTDMVA